MEPFEAFTELVETLICDFPAPVRKSTNPSYKSFYLKKLRLTYCNALDLLRLSPTVFRSSSHNSSQLLSLEIYDFLFSQYHAHIPRNQGLKSYSLQQMLIRRILFIDFITFVTAFIPPSCLFEIRFDIASSFYRKLSSIFKIMASVVFANCWAIVPLSIFISYLLDYGDISNQSLTYFY